MFNAAQSNGLRADTTTTPERYLAVNTAIGAALSGGNDFTFNKKVERAAFLFHSPRYGRMAYDEHLTGQDRGTQYFEHYFADVPRPFCFSELDRPELRRLLDLYGPDLMRANFLSPNLIGTDDLPLITGGACALETWATRLLNKVSLQQSSGLRREVLMHMLDSAPYYTHVTGAMLLGPTQLASVLYDETFPWCMTIYSLGHTPQMSDQQWNPGLVKEITRDLYNRIYAGVIRRATLISPQAERPLRLPFDDLQLEDAGHLRAWYSQYIEALPEPFSRFRPSHYEPEGFMGAYVRYTYVGPDILDIVKRKLAFVAGLNEHTMHVRTKQDDHLTEEVRINQMLLQGMHEGDPGFLDKYANICKLAIYFWQKRNWDKGRNGFVGFTDLSFRGNIVHDTVNLTTGSNSELKTEEELWDILTSPVRLNRRNIDDHFLYLDKHLDYVFVYDDIASEILKLHTDICKAERKLRNIVWHAQERRLIRELFNDLVQGFRRGDSTVTIDYAALERIFGAAAPSKLLEHLRNVPRRYKRKAAIAEYPQSVPLLIDIFNALSLEVLGGSVLVSINTHYEVEKYCPLLSKLMTVLDDELRGYYAREKDERAKLLSLKRAYADAAPGLSDTPLHEVPLHELDLSCAKPTLLPLRDNLVFSHAIQLSFDPDISSFIIDTVEIEGSALSIREKKRLIVQACRKILPLIKAHLRFILDESAAPNVKHRRKWIQRETYEPVFSKSLC